MAFATNLNIDIASGTDEYLRDVGKLSLLKEEITEACLVSKSL